MALIYSLATQKFIHELNRLTSIPHDESKRHLKSPKELKNLRKLYESDTSKFEPIAKNREHLITSLMPMVLKIAKDTTRRYGSSIEYNDCISSGMQGAIIATDIYIEKSSIEPQPAKLSTYAHSYIKKYINEYCRDANSILSHGPTKWWEAGKETVVSGNQKYTHENKSVEVFDIINDTNLVSSQDDLISSKELSFELSSTLCNKLNDFDRAVIILLFGLNNDSPKTPKEIAKILNCSIIEVESSSKNSIRFLQSTLTKDEIIINMKLR